MRRNWIIQLFAAALLAASINTMAADLTVAVATIDFDEYKTKLQRAQRIVAEEVPIIPTHFQVAVWASRKGIEYEARADESSLAESALAK